MTVQRMEHVGIMVDDHAVATAFFVELGLKLQGEGPVEGSWVDRVVGLEGVRAEIAMMETPTLAIEQGKYSQPAPKLRNNQQVTGYRHTARRGELAFASTAAPAAVGVVPADNAVVSIRDQHARIRRAPVDEERMWTVKTARPSLPSLDPRYRPSAENRCTRLCP